MRSPEQLAPVSPYAASPDVLGLRISHCEATVCAQLAVLRANRAFKIAANVRCRTGPRPTRAVTSPSTMPCVRGPAEREPLHEGAGVP